MTDAVGYYVHHHGSGHLTRARTVAARLGGRVTGLSSLGRPDDWAGDWVLLPHDAEPRPVSDADVTAGGGLHWAPLHHEGYRARMAAIAGWVAMARPRVVVVDVSVEVTMLVRLLGVPVAVVAMRGDRSDRAHALAYDAADALLALWPAALASQHWPQAWADKTCHVGAFSRVDELARSCPPQRPPAAPGTVLLLWGHGGVAAALESDMAAAVEATAGRWAWSRPAPTASAVELWEELGRAEVVVTHAGQNAVAEVAASRLPAVVVAEQRPFDEQVETAQVLDEHGIAVGLPGWPQPREWPALLTRARDLGGHRWALWSDLHGADRFADSVRRLAGS